MTTQLDRPSIPLPEVPDLLRAVAQPGEHVVAVRAKVWGDTDLRRGLRKIPTGVMHFQTSLLILDLGAGRWPWDRRSRRRSSSVLTM